MAPLKRAKGMQKRNQILNPYPVGRLELLIGGKFSMIFLGKMGGPLISLEFLGNFFGGIWEEGFPSGEGI